MELERQIYQDLASTTTDDTVGMLLMAWLKYCEPQIL